MEEIKMLNREEIKDKLYELLSDVGSIESDDEDAGNGILIGDMDSIQLISLVVEIEEFFNVELPDEYLVSEFFENEEHVVDVIEQLIKKEFVEVDI